jgi:hypothetical protein
MRPLRLCTWNIWIIWIFSCTSTRSLGQTKGFPSSHNIIPDISSVKVLNILSSFFVAVCQARFPCLALCKFASEQFLQLRTWTNLQCKLKCAVLHILDLQLIDARSVFWYKILALLVRRIIWCELWRSTSNSPAMLRAAPLVWKSCVHTSTLVNTTDCGNSLAGPTSEPQFVPSSCSPLEL